MKRLANGHPGEVLLQEFLLPLGVGQEQFARRVGVPAEHIEDIVSAKATVRATDALRFAKAFGTTARFWLGLQDDHDLENARIALGERLDRIERLVAPGVETPVRVAGLPRANVVGVDGARDRWISVWREGNGFAHALHATPRDLLLAHADAVVIAVDIPIGLSDRNGRGPDQLARKFVGGKRASSIFSAPVRGVLDAQSQSEASARHREIDGRGFGAQSFAILPKIRAWDEALRADAKAAARVHEIHPEVSFAALNGGIGLVAPKKSGDGAQQRRELLAHAFGEAPVAALLASVSRKHAASDDVLDALVALWTGDRIASGDARSLPDPPTFDSAGLRTAIWY